MRMKPPPDVSGWTTPEAYYTWSRVEESINTIDAIVYRPAIEFAQEQFLSQARSCPTCGTAPSDLFWLAMEDADDAWDAGNGRAGWLTICERRKLQVDFIVDEEATREYARNWREFGALS